MGPASAKREHNSNAYAAAAAVLLFAGSSVEVLRIVLGAPWPGWSTWFSNTVSILLTIVWSSAALAVLLRHKHRWLASSAWALSLAAPLVMVVHAIFTRVGGSNAGLLYVPAGALVVLGLKRTWDGHEFRWLRRFTARQT